MNLILEKLFWFGVVIFLAIVIFGITSNPHIDLTPYLVFIFIVGFLFLQAHKKGELDIGLLVVNGLLVCLCFVAHEKVIVISLSWGVILLVLYSLPVVRFMSR